jgi:8-oxo-dGTP diphosphatase
VTIYLVRHAKAGERDSWPGEDWLRPLSRRGQHQAEHLLDVFSGLAVELVLSSPYVRCLESVVPLAGWHKVAIEPVDELAEGAAFDDVIALVRKHLTHETVMCTHGDIVPMVLDWVRVNGVDVGSDPQWPKGSTWVLHTDTEGEVVRASYIPNPPDS